MPNEQQELGHTGTQPLSDYDEEPENESDETLTDTLFSLLQKETATPEITAQATRDPTVFTTNGAPISFNADCFFSATAKAIKQGSVSKAELNNEQPELINSSSHKKLKATIE